MGLSFVAIGVSIPDVLASVAVARDGKSRGGEGRGGGGGKVDDEGRDRRGGWVEGCGETEWTSRLTTEIAEIRC